MYVCLSVCLSYLLLATHYWTIETAKGLKVIHLNIRSLVLKTDLLRAWVTLYKPNIITISETWLHNNITDDKIEIDNFVLSRAHRASRGGGVALYIAEHIISECVIPNVEPVNFECLFINIILHDNKHLTIGNIYRPNSTPASSTNNILSTINSLEKHNELFILGDFNSNWLDRILPKIKIYLVV